METKLIDEHMRREYNALYIGTYTMPGESSVRAYQGPHGRFLVETAAFKQYAKATVVYSFAEVLLRPAS